MRTMMCLLAKGTLWKGYELSLVGPEELYFFQGA